MNNIFRDKFEKVAIDLNLSKGKKFKPTKMLSEKEKADYKRYGKENMRMMESAKNRGDMAEYKKVRGQSEAYAKSNDEFSKKMKKRNR